ncbi:hypothetical protein GW17_00001741, partial [Ensete ventricosum]
GSGGTKLPVEEKKTCVLKVRLCCVGCQKKIRKALLKIDGVRAIDLDVKEGKVIVTGNVDPAILIKKLRKVRKVAELLPTTEENIQPHKEDSDEEKKKTKKTKNGDEERVETRNEGGGEQSTTYRMEQRQNDKAGGDSWPPSPPHYEVEWPFWANFSDDHPTICLIM